MPSPRLDIPAPRIEGTNVIIELKKPRLAAVWSSNSMERYIDSGHCLIEETEFTQDDIHIAQVIVHSGGIVHSVYALGADIDGWFCRTWGDNNYEPDPQKVRFEDIEAIVVCPVWTRNFWFGSNDGD